MGKLNLLGPKLSKEYMIESIKEDLLIYFRDGIINPRPFFDLDTREFYDMDQVLDLHFMLTDEVFEFISSLEDNIREVKNSTLLNKSLFRGQVRGRIDWTASLDHRNNTNPRDRTSFVCHNVDKFYNSHENLVLKYLLKLLYEKNLDLCNFKGLNWSHKFKDYGKTLTNTYKKNVYIKKIDIANLKIDKKILSRVEKSRYKLYRQSAKLLKLYRDIKLREVEALESLFSKTFIDLKTESEVFEFYSIFNYIRRKFPKERVKFKLVDGKEPYLASLEDGDYSYKFYHNRSASDYLNFKLRIGELRGSDNIFLDKKLESLDHKARIYKTLRGLDLGDNYRSFRPDLLIVKLEGQELRGLTIGEIKYTNNFDYMIQGLEELLEYLYLVRNRDGEFLDRSILKGILFVDNIALERKSFGQIELINREDHLDLMAGD